MVDKKLFADFAGNANAVVIGASGGIGRAFTEQLAAHPGFAGVYAFSRSTVPAFNTVAKSAKIRPSFLDLQDESSIQSAAALASAEAPLDLIIVATGVLHNQAGLQPEKSLRSLQAQYLMQSYAINAIGPALVAKHFLPYLRCDRKVVFVALSARVGSIGDNRLGGWHAYRASKAALNMLIRNIAIETARRHKQAVIAGLHPGTVDTGLSKPFQGNVPAHKLFTPEYAAQRLLTVIDTLTPQDSGKLFAWDGKPIPY